MARCKYGFIMNKNGLRSLESLGKPLTVGRMSSVNYFTVYCGIQVTLKACGPLVLAYLGFFITENYSVKFKRFVAVWTKQLNLKCLKAFKARKRTRMVIFCQCTWHISKNNFKDDDIVM